MNDEEIIAKLEEVKQRRMKGNSNFDAGVACGVNYALLLLTNQRRKEKAKQ